MKRANLLYIGICLAIVVVVGFTAVYFFTQNNKPKTTFEVMPIQMPQYEVNSEKPAPYINISIKNNGDIDQTNVAVKILGGFSDSSSQFPDQLDWITTENFSLIRSGETVTAPKIFGFGWYFFYRIEVSSSTVAKETFDQWVSWRSWTVPKP